MSRLRLAVRRRRGNAISHRIHGDDEIFTAIHEFTRPYQIDEIVRAPVSPSGKQHRIRAVKIAVSEGAITNRAIADYISVLQPEVGQISELLSARVRRLLGLRHH